MELTDGQVLAWLGHFLWPFLRVTGLFLTAPLFGSSYIPAVVKALAAAALAAALALWLPGLPPFPGDPASAIYQGVTQITYGAVLGLTMQIIVSAVAGAGEIAGLSIGLGFAELQFREANTPTPILYDVMYWAGTIAFIATGGPVMLFAALAHSFEPGVMIRNIGSWDALISEASHLVTAAVWLAMPVLSVALAINITVGLNTIFAPQMNLLTIGFPILILSGLWIFASSIPFMGGDFHQLMAVGMRALAAVARDG